MDNLMYIKVNTDAHLVMLFTDKIVFQEDLIIPHVNSSKHPSSSFINISIALYLLRLHYQQSSRKIGSSVQFRRPRRCALAG